LLARLGCELHHEAHGEFWYLSSLHRPPRRRKMVPNIKAICTTSLWALSCALPGGEAVAISRSERGHIGRDLAGGAR
jgi:hypothetical protein